MSESRIINPSRRGFLFGLSAIVATPLIIRALPVPLRTSLPTILLPERLESRYVVDLERLEVELLDDEDFEGERVIYQGQFVMPIGILQRLEPTKVLSSLERYYQIERESIRARGRQPPRRIGSWDLKRMIMKPESIERDSWNEEET